MGGTNRQPLRPWRLGGEKIPPLAKRLQILVLTCHPERYRGLEGANFIDLEPLVRRAA